MPAREQPSARTYPSPQAGPRPGPADQGSTDQDPTDQGRSPGLRFDNWIAGRAVSAAAALPVIEPATGQPYAMVSDSGSEEVEAAVAAAVAAFPSWAATPAARRSEVLLRLAGLVEARADELARAESRDTGKPLAVARSVDIPRSAANLRYFATAILHAATEAFEFDGAGVPGGEPALNVTVRRSRGVAGLISPWNLPLYLLTWKIAPALATGNTAVAKPSEVTPATATMLAELSAEAGLPPGVLNIVHGRGDVAGAAIVSHPAVPAISFTGSTAVGRWIGQTAGSMLKRLSLELGGKNPFVVLSDADQHVAAAAAVRAGFSNQGQICLCGSRLLVHESLFERVVAAVAEKAAALRVGDPDDPATDQGALVSRAHLEKVDAAVRLARDLGGRIHCGGGPVPPADLPPRCRGGFFYRPTVISGLDPACRVEQEEIFGPVVTATAFRDDDHAVALANGTPYGLAATVFGSDARRLLGVAGRIDAGIVWVNGWMIRDLRTPFGGSKQSGVGREGGSEALRFFTEPKNVCVRL